MSGAQFLTGTEIWAFTGSLKSPNIKVLLIRVVSFLLYFHYPSIIRGSDSLRLLLFFGRNPKC